MKIVLIFTLGLLLVLNSSCKKVFSKSESIPLRKITLKTILKNHTNGADYSIGADGLEVIAELIIEEGVEIEIVQGGILLCKDSGFILANGTEQNPVVFKPKKGNKSWGGIVFSGKIPSNLVHTKIMNAGDGTVQNAGLFATNQNKLVLNHTEIFGTGSCAAIKADNASTIEIQAGCHLHHSFVPIETGLDSKIIFKEPSLFDQNAKNVIYLKNPFGNIIEITGNDTLIKKPLPYYLADGLLINGGNAIIEAGVELQFGPASMIMINNNYSKLICKGNVFNPIIIGNDPTQALITDQTWKGINISTGRADISYTIIKDVICSDTTQGAIVVFGNSQLALNKSTISNCSGTCSITSYGTRVSINPNINTNNTFIKSKKHCNR